jgi:hypothetical protein
VILITGLSLFVVLATFSATETISCSDKKFIKFIIRDLLTAIKPAFDALECQFMCPLSIWLTKVLVLMSCCLASYRKFLIVSLSSLNVILSLLPKSVADFFATFHFLMIMIYLLSISSKIRYLSIHRGLIYYTYTRII